MSDARILPTPLPTVEAFDAMSLAEQVAVLLPAIASVLERFRRHAATRHAEGRQLSAADAQRLHELVIALEALRVDVRERLEPGTTDRTLREAFANITLLETH